MNFIFPKDLNDVDKISNSSDLKGRLKILLENENIVQY